MALAQKLKSQWSIEDNQAKKPLNAQNTLEVLDDSNWLNPRQEDWSTPLALRSAHHPHNLIGSGQEYAQASAVSSTAAFNTITANSNSTLRFQKASDSTLVESPTLKHSADTTSMLLLGTVTQALSTPESGAMSISGATSAKPSKTADNGNESSQCAILEPKTLPSTLDTAQEEIYRMRRDSAMHAERDRTQSLHHTNMPTTPQFSPFGNRPPYSYWLPSGSPLPAWGAPRSATKLFPAYPGTALASQIAPNTPRMAVLPAPLPSTNCAIALPGTVAPPNTPKMLCSYAVANSPPGAVAQPHTPRTLEQAVIDPSPDRRVLRGRAMDRPAVSAGHGSTKSDSRGTTPLVEKDKSTV